MFQGGVSLPPKQRSTLNQEEPHYKLLALALDKVRSSGEFAEDVVFAMIDAIMGGSS